MYLSLFLSFFFEALQSCLVVAKQMLVALGAGLRAWDSYIRSIDIRVRRSRIYEAVRIRYAQTV